MHSIHFIIRLTNNEDCCKKSTYANRNYSHCDRKPIEPAVDICCEKSYSLQIGPACSINLGQGSHIFVNHLLCSQPEEVRHRHKKRHYHSNTGKHNVETKGKGHLKKGCYKTVNSVIISNYIA